MFWFVVSLIDTSKEWHVHFIYFFIFCNFGLSWISFSNIFYKSTHNLVVCTFVYYVYQLWLTSDTDHISKVNLCVAAHTKFISLIHLCSDTGGARYQHNRFLVLCFVLFFCSMHLLCFEDVYLQADAALRGHVNDVSAALSCIWCLCVSTISPYEASQAFPVNRSVMVKIRIQFDPDNLASSSFAAALAALFQIQSFVLRLVMQLIIYLTEYDACLFFFCLFFVLQSVFCVCVLFFL